ncbi:MAG: hypothetical protein RL528_772 [Bacteroidota bacterium]
MVLHTGVRDVGSGDGDYRGGVVCLICLKMFIVIILSKSLKVYFILVRFRSKILYCKKKPLIYQGVYCYSVIRSGFEPEAFALEGRCSIQLS